jgi:hypothetical protein
MSSALSVVSKMLGDLGPKDDATFDGSVSTSALSADYYRTKLSEFQAVLNALDAGYQAAQQTYYIEGVDPASLEGLDDLMRDYESKRSTLRATAEALNFGAAAVNAAGGRMPSLSLPATLGVPFLVPAAFVAAVASAAALIVWGREWLKGLNVRLSRAQLLEAARDPASGGSPEIAGALAAQMARADDALQAADASPLSSIANLVKWGAIGLGLFLAYRAYKGSKFAQ